METRKTGDILRPEHYYNIIAWLFVEPCLTIDNEDEDNDEDMRHLLDDQSPDQENR